MMCSSIRRRSFYARSGWLPPLHRLQQRPTGSSSFVTKKPSRTRARAGSMEIGKQLLTHSSTGVFRAGGRLPASDELLFQRPPVADVRRAGHVSALAVSTLPACHLTQPMVMKINRRARNAIFVSSILTYSTQLGDSVVHGASSTERCESQSIVASERHAQNSNFTIRRA